MITFPVPTDSLCPDPDWTSGAAVCCPDWFPDHSASEGYFPAVAHWDWAAAHSASAEERLVWWYSGFRSDPFRLGSRHLESLYSAGFHWESFRSDSSCSDCLYSAYPSPEWAADSAVSLCPAIGGLRCQEPVAWPCQDFRSVPQSRSYSVAVLHLPEPPARQPMLRNQEQLQINLFFPRT
jgi:hypothetical protein